MTDHLLNHLNPIPPEMVDKVCDRIERSLAIHLYSHGIRLELDAFRRDKTAWDARRLANVLAYFRKCPELVKELDALAKSWGGLEPGLNRGGKIGG